MAQLCMAWRGACTEAQLSSAQLDDSLCSAELCCALVLRVAGSIDQTWPVDLLCVKQCQAESRTKSSQQLVYFSTKLSPEAASAAGFRNADPSDPRSAGHCSSGPE